MSGLPPIGRSAGASMRNIGGRTSGYRGRGRGRGGSNPSTGRATHFLALPLDQHTALQGRVSKFTAGILSHHASIPINGVEPSIMQQPQRIHMTLGVMALVDANPSGSATSVQPMAHRDSPKSVADALALLESLRGQILALMGGADELQVPLEGLDIMNNDKQAAYVVWTGPGSRRDDTTLWKVSLVVHQAFKDAGFLHGPDATRPLKLHCTFVNSTFRRPPSRIPFSFQEICERIANDPGLVGLPEASYSATDIQEKADFGTWGVDSIQLYKMGSWDPDRRYVSLGHVSLKA